MVVTMKKYIKSAINNNKVTGKGWPAFVRNIEDTLGYEVDSAYRRTFDDFIILYKDGVAYQAEVTPYSDGSYELMEYNIHELN